MLLTLGDLLDIYDRNLPFVVVAVADNEVLQRELFEISGKHDLDPKYLALSVIDIIKR